MGPCRCCKVPRQLRHGEGQVWAVCLSQPVEAVHACAVCLLLSGSHEWFVRHGCGVEKCPWLRKWCECRDLHVQRDPEADGHLFDVVGVPEGEDSSLTIVVDREPQVQGAVPHTGELVLGGTLLWSSFHVASSEQTTSASSTCRLRYVIPVVVFR